jgi:hypothetical protein
VKKSEGCTKSEGCEEGASCSEGEVEGKKEGIKGNLRRDEKSVKAVAKAMKAWKWWQNWFGTHTTCTPFIVFVCGIILLDRKPHPTPFPRLFAGTLVWITRYIYAVYRVCLRDYFVGSQLTTE